MPKKPWSKKRGGRGYSQKNRPNTLSMVDKRIQQEDDCVMHLRCLEEENRFLWYGKALSKNKTRRKKKPCSLKRKHYTDELSIPKRKKTCSLRRTKH